MKRTHRLPARFIRWTSLCVCFALVLSCLVVTPLGSFDHSSTALAQGQTGSLNGNAKKVEPAPPLAGPPAANLSNLDEVKLRGQEAPHAPESVSSTLRSRRKPLEPRLGRKVGDPLPPVRLGSHRTRNRSDHTDRASSATRSLPGGLSRSHHVRRSLSSNFLVTPMPQGGSGDNVTWTNVVGVTASGNSLTKNSSDGWNAGAVSTQTIASGDGYMEVTATETNTHRRIGLSHGDTNQSWEDIDFCIYLSADGTVYVNEGTNGRGNFGSYAAGDRFRVAVEGGVVKYKKNGTVFYTSTVAPAYPLLVDTSLHTNGATLTNVVIGSGNGAGTFSEQYPQNLISWALARQPSSDEVNYWEDILRAAYAHQQGSMLLALREMGRTIFESAEYAARGRSDHWYVYDLY